MSWPDKKRRAFSSMSTHKLIWYRVRYPYTPICDTGVQFMYDFAEGRPGLGAALFLPWASWVLVWAAAMLMLLSLSGACVYIRRFTRFSGELFGGLIALLFLQQAIKVLASQISPNATRFDAIWLAFAAAAASAH